VVNGVIIGVSFSAGEIAITLILTLRNHNRNEGFVTVSVNEF
jgi:zinc transporter ZupT